MLASQLQTFHVNYTIDSDLNIHSVLKLVVEMSEAEKMLYSQIVRVVSLLLVAPSTNAIRIKTYLRSTMCQDRLNAIMVMHVHKALTDNLDLKYAAK